MPQKTALVSSVVCLDIVDNDRFRGTVPIMIDELLKEWEGLQKIPTDGNPAVIKNKTNRENAIVESLQREGYAGTLTGLNGLSIQQAIDVRQKAMREVNDRLRESRRSFQKF